MSIVTNQDKNKNDYREPYNAIRINWRIWTSRMLSITVKSPTNRHIEKTVRILI